MSIMVFAPNVAVTPPTRSISAPVPEYTYLWTGVDGVTWDLNDWSTGVYLASGLIGVGHSPAERWTQDSPGIPGSIFGGARSLAQAFQLPTVITTTTSIESSWRDLCRRWWKGWSKTQPGTLRMVDSTGASKSIQLRHNPDGQFALDIDPGLIPWVPWMVNAIADFPYWRGDPIVQSWGSPTQYLFFSNMLQPGAGVTESGPPFTISSAATLSKAELTNPGDTDAWLTFTIDGPFTSWSITVADGTVSGPAVADGDQVVVITDPTYPTAFLNGDTDISGQVAWDPRPMPPGVDVPITISAVGTGTITAELDPLYEIGL